MYVNSIIASKAGINNLISWNHLFTPYLEHLQCCLEEPFNYCDFYVAPSNGSIDLIKSFGNHAKFCYLEHEACTSRKMSLWKTCHLENPLFLPDSRGVGKVLEIS